MSLNLTLVTATSGLQAAQAGLNAVSNNIANVNTPGYVRTTVNQQPLALGGVSAGVQVVGLKRITDQYLEAASQSAGADASRLSAYSQGLDTAQGLFGDPSTSTSFFSQLDQVYSGFAAAANDPSSPLLRSQAAANVQNFLGQAQQINTQLNTLGTTTDTRIGSDVDTANSLLTQIDALNAVVSRAQVTNADASGAQNQQAQLVSQLTSLIGVRVSARANGGVDIRSPEGVSLVGETTGAARLVYNSSSSTPGYITVASADGSGAPQPIQVAGGEIRGLMDLRNTALPQLSDQLGEFVQRAVEQLNDAHNAATASPAPQSLTGRNTGLDVGTAVSNFTGQSTVAIVDSAGAVQETVAIDFDNGTLSVNGGAPTGFSAGTFDSDLSAALSPYGSASFSNGALAITASASGSGVAIDEGTSQKAGRGFSAYFGLNDLVTSTGLGTYDTGMVATDPSGFTPGDTITLRLSQTGGAPIRDVTVAVPAAGTVGDLVNALNSNSSGVGLYGSFTLSAQGALTFTGSAPANATVSVVQDNTQRGGPGGPSISQLFGLGVAQRSSRVAQYQVNPTIAGDPSKLAFATLNLSAAAGTPAIGPGDGTGALALSNAGNVATLFDGAGGLGSASMTVSGYASQFSGGIGRSAAAAASNLDAATAVKTEADSRLQSTEGVNLDEELVSLTTYQQAFNASARMIQATKDLFDVLTNMLT